MNRLREYRGAEGLTVRELAAELDHEISYQSISAIENGNHMPSLKVARLLADYFEVPIETLFPREKA